MAGIVITTCDLIIVKWAPLGDYATHAFNLSLNINTQRMDRMGNTSVSL